MKFAVVFILATFAVLAQTNAKAVDGSVDRGAIVDALKVKLSAAKEKLDGLLNKASDALKKKIAQVARQAEELIAQLKQKYTDISDEFYQTVQKILDKVGYYEDRVVEEAEKIVN